MSEAIDAGQAGLLLAILAAVSGAGLVVSIGFVVVDRLGLRSKLRDIDDLYNLVDIRDQELMLTFSDRMASPVLRRLSELGRRFSPAGRIEGIRTMLRRAGRADADTDRYLAFRVLSIIAAPFAAYGGWVLGASQGPMIRLAFVGLGFSCCTVLPSRRLRASVEARETAIRRQLPDIMDLLIICMEAGLGFTSAMSRTVANVDGEMSEEFGLVLGDMRAGASRGDALASLAERVHLPELRSFVLSIRQADQFGVSVSTVLRNQAEDMRITRRQIAQTKAMKAPVKMLIPMVFCIFPPMFIVVIGPAALSITSSGGF
jgi:tight adherence protein C